MPKERIIRSGKSSILLADDAILFAHAGFGTPRALREASPHRVAYADIVAVEFIAAGSITPGHLVVATDHGAQPRRANNPSALDVVATTTEAKSQLVDFAEELLRRSKVSEFSDVPAEGRFRAAKPTAGKGDTPPPAGAGIEAGSGVTPRFNPAPGWPQPPQGWLPAPGWKPDPSWPAPPPGWELVTSALETGPVAHDARPGAPVPPEPAADLRSLHEPTATSSQAEQRPALTTDDGAGAGTGGNLVQDRVESVDRAPEGRKHDPSVAADLRPAAQPVAEETAAPRGDARVVEHEPSAQTSAHQQVEVHPLSSQAPASDLVALLEERVGSLEAAEAAIKRTRERLKEIEKETVSAIKVWTRANESTHIMSVGLVRRVVLHDSHLQLPRARVTMSPEVHATADNQGTKQVLRGSVWTGPRTADRREMMLQVSWPGGHEVVRWERNDDSMAGSMVTPTEVHRMAAAINLTAQRSPAGPADRDQRRRTAIATLARAATRLHKEAEALLAELDQHAQTSTAVQAFALGLQDLGALDHRERRTIKDLDARASKAERLAREALPTGQQLLARLAPPWPGVSSADAQRAQQADATQPALEAAPQQQRPTPPTTPPSGDQAPPQPPQPADLADLLRQLGQLRDAGVLTEEEFASKKAEILSRL